MDSFVASLTLLSAAFSESLTFSVDLVDHLATWPLTLPDSLAKRSFNSATCLSDSLIKGSTLLSLARSLTFSVALVDHLEIWSRTLPGDSLAFFSTSDDLLTSSLTLVTSPLASSAALVDHFDT